MANDPTNNNGENDLEAKESYWNWKEFKTNVVKASEAAPDSSIRGRRLLDTVDRWFRQLDGYTLRYIPEAYHPFTQAGAIANFMFVVAVLTGFALLIWYSPSVHHAYDSVASMADKPYTAELMRSLHRYSSDAFMLFVFFHAFKVFFAARFTGSRWLAWITGIVGLGIIWFDGWLGYWLVWDDRAAMVAIATAKMLDVLPIFAEPLTASFLTDDSFNSVLFVIVFFLHMLIPIGFGIAVWLHVSRLNSPVFITNKNFSIMLLASLVVISLIYPADIGSRADLMSTPEDVKIDYFYLMPLIMTERLQGGMLWLIALGTFIVIASVPWVMSRRKTDVKPVVDEIKCNGCTQCFYDCPYNAVTMMPREKGNPKKSEFVANIDPSVCVSCGICVGSCDPVAIEFPNLSPWEMRRKLDSWLDEEKRTFEGEHVAFVCGNSAGSSLTIDPKTGRCKEMPGYLVCTLPCAGWIHPALIERALKNDAEGVLVAGCESDPDYRLGADWLGSRIEGERHPEFRKDRFEIDRILYLKMDKPEFNRLLDEAQQFRKDKDEKKQKVKKGPGWKTVAAGIFVGGLIAALTVWPSAAELSLPDRESQLVISFKKQGTPVYAKEEDDSQRLTHMQRQDGPRVARRADVFVRVMADGEVVFEDQYRPKGIFRRGYSSGIVNVPLNPGSNDIEVLFGDQVEGEDIEWNYTDQRELEIEKGERVVLKFDEQYGYRWYR